MSATCSGQARLPQPPSCRDLFFVVAIGQGSGKVSDVVHVLDLHVNKVPRGWDGASPELQAYQPPQHELLLLLSESPEHCIAWHAFGVFNDFEDQIQDFQLLYLHQETMVRTCKCSAVLTDSSRVSQV